MAPVFVWGRSRVEGNRPLLNGRGRKRAWEILGDVTDLKGVEAPVVIAVGGFQAHPQFREICAEITIRGGLLVQAHPVIRDLLRRDEGLS